MNSDSFKNNVINKLIKSTSTDKQDPTLNNSQGLICHKRQPTKQTNEQTNQYIVFSSMGSPVNKLHFYF